MHNTANVYLWGTHVGTVLLQDESPIAKFQYADEFLDMGVEVSPLRMPLSSSVFEFPDLPIKSFHGLPGLLSDSLPDKFGNKVIAAWLREQGKRPEDLNAVDRLCYAGRRGMGALEYKPALVDKEDTSERLTVDALSELADRVLKMREDAKASLVPGISEYASILKVGSSAGGARAKALIGWNEATGEVRSGQVTLPEGFGYWLIKFDGLTGNGDKEGDDKWGYGRVGRAHGKRRQGRRRQMGLRARRIRLPSDGSRSGNRDDGVSALEQAPLHDAPFRQTRGRRQAACADARSARAHGFQQSGALFLRGRF